MTVHDASGVVIHAKLAFGTLVFDIYAIPVSDILTALALDIIHVTHVFDIHPLVFGIHNDCTWRYYNILA